MRIIEVKSFSVGIGSAPKRREHRPRGGVMVANRACGVSCSLSRAASLLLGVSLVAVLPMRASLMERPPLETSLPEAGLVVAHLTAPLTEPLTEANFAKASLFELIFHGLRIIELSNLSAAEETELGEKINQQILSDVELYDNPAIASYVSAIGQDLAAGRERSQINYTFYVVRDNRLNAYSTLGGFVYINTGVLRAAENEAQLASVLSHEMAHIERRHVVKRLQQAAIAEGVLSAGGINQNAAVALGVDLALHRPNSRAHELEADRTGLTLLTRAGYAPIAAVDMLEKLIELDDDTPEFLATHPHPEARINALNAQIDPDTARIGKGLDSAAYRSHLGDL